MTKRKQILEDTIKLAEEAFKNHKIIKATEDRWVLATDEKSSIFKTEIIALYNNSIYVGGDIDVVVFSYGPCDIMERLKWIGYATSYEYVQEKAKIGTSRQFKEIDDAVAAEDLNDLMRQQQEDGDFETSERIDDLWYRIPDYSYIESELYDIFCESISVGRIISSSIIYAKEAVKKLCELLEKQND